MNKNKFEIYAYIEDNVLSVGIRSTANFNGADFDGLVYYQYYNEGEQLPFDITVDKTENGYDFYVDKIYCGEVNNSESLQYTGTL